MRRPRFLDPPVEPIRQMRKTSDAKEPKSFPPHRLPSPRPPPSLPRRPRWNSWARSARIKRHSIRTLRGCAVSAMVSSTLSSRPCRRSGAK
eukprot:9194540-Pyramimonas_sp.AAC.1